MGRSRERASLSAVCLLGSWEHLFWRLDHELLFGAKGIGRRVDCMVEVGSQLVGMSVSRWMLLIVVVRDSMAWAMLSLGVFL